MLLDGFCSSKWQRAKLNEDKKNKILSVMFPKAHQLSNGQRDIVTLVVQMHKALCEGSKKPLILIIDEVFDYLDDANLVAFQYYVTSLIERYKKQGQTLYPLILTHLDPGVFFDFCFNKHKIHTHYLYPHTSGSSKNILKLIEARDNNDAIKNDVVTYWFHYHCEQREIDGKDWPKNLPDAWRKSEDFHRYTHNQIINYFNSKTFDSIAICFAVRIEVERQAYNLLSDSDKKEFLQTHRTCQKLDFASSRLADIPEMYFLLGLIYNTNLHWIQDRDYETPLMLKLSHPTIKSLIQKVFIGNCNYSCM
jgi:hypothetical protein